MGGSPDRRRRALWPPRGLFGAAEAPGAAGRAEAEPLGRSGRLLRPVAAGFAVLFVACAALFALIPQRHNAVDAWWCLGMAAALAGLVAGTARRRISPSWVERIAVLIAVVLPLNAVGYLVQTREPRQTTSVMLLLIGSAAVLPSTRSFGAALVAGLGSWGYARMTVASAEWGHFDAAMACAAVVAVTVFASRRTTARRLAEARAELRHMAVVDDLTGLYNRRGFEMLAEQAMLDADRSGSALTLLFVDVDGLAAVNRALGRHTGDAVLQETASLLRSAFRGADVVARVGGDEFCALLPSASPGVSYRDRLHSAVIEANARDGRAYTLALSIGEAGYDPARPAPVDDLLAGQSDALSADKGARR